jgi:diacylglycerol kinase family enzyme
MPYFYLYDSYLQDRSYASTLIKLETTLTDLGIQGRVGRLTLLKSVKDIVESAVRDGADTIVAVGNDITLSQVAQAAIKHPKVTVGFVPLGSSQQNLAPLLGIPLGILACHVLSSRLVEDLPIGKINNQFFLQSVILSGTPILECEDSYELSLDEPHEVRVCNLTNEPSPPTSSKKTRLTAIITPQHNKRLGLFGQNKLSPSAVTISALRVSSDGDELPLTVDNYRVLKTPATITTAQQRLRIIVGKKRLI